MGELDIWKQIADANRAKVPTPISELQPQVVPPLMLRDPVVPLTLEPGEEEAVPPQRLTYTPTKPLTQKTPRPAVEKRRELTRPAKPNGKPGDNPATELTSELKWLRRGSGLNVTRMAKCPRLQEALHTPNPQHAYDRLRALLTQLGIGRDARALRIVYGIEPDMSPVTRGTVSRRDLTREEFAYPDGDRMSHRTVLSWENAAIEEVVERLIARTSGGLESLSADLLSVRAWVTGDRIDRISTLMMHDRDEGETQKIQDDTNPADHYPSLPLVSQYFDGSWTVDELEVFVYFQSPRPRRAWRFRSHLDLRGFGPNMAWAERRRELDVASKPGSDGEYYVRARWDRPEPGVLYAVTWQY